MTTKYLNGFVQVTMYLLVSTLINNSHGMMEEVVLVGFPVELNCTVNGTSMDDSNWKKDGEPLNSPQSSQQRIEFSHVLNNDSGIYQCNEDAAEIELVVLDKPSPPRSLEAVVLPNEVSLKWQPSFNADYITLLYYIIQQRNATSASLWQNISTSNVTRKTAVIDSLHANTSYQFQILALAENGNMSDASNIVNITTPTAVIPGPPEEFKSSGVTAENITLKWQKPNGTDVSDITAYKLYVWDLHESLQNISLGSKRTRHKLTDLNAGTVYKLALTAVTNGGEGPPANLTVKTDIKAPSIPRGVSVKYLMAKSALVMWAHPASAQVDFYLIKYREITGPWFYKSVKPLYYYMDNLKLHATYEIIIQAATYSILHPEKYVPYYGPETRPYIYIHGIGQSTTTTADSLVPTVRLVTSIITNITAESSDGPVRHNKWFKAAIIAGTVLFIVFVVLAMLACFVWRKSYHARHYYTRADIVSPQPPAELGFPDLKTLLQKDSIDILDFEKHVIEAHADSNHGFSVEYEEIRKVSTKALTFFHSNLPENKNKNRYLDIVAYDQTRVHLAPITGRQRSSDYINANYVDGYEKQRTYIASQGPLKATVNDFWRMIWEQGSVIVIMLTNLVEKGKRKCEQYWPTEGTELYGSIEVTLEDTNILAAYTIRRFIIKNIKGRKIRGQHGDRLIYQYHYTAWPDHGIPEDSLPVITFVKKSPSANPPDAGPIIVHCSAGVGRTGTYIVIDTMLRQIKETQHVSVLAFMKHIRQQRNYLVQTEDQYIFLHDALLEAFKCGDTEIGVDDYNSYVDDQLESKILLPDDTEMSLMEKQFKRITSYMPKDYEFHSATRPYNKGKNRSEDTLPVDRSRVKLVPKPGEDGSDYINASYLQGYRLNQEYLITQHPLEHTVVDFWRMIWDQNSETIVSLISLESMEEGDLMVYWPTSENSSLNCGSFSVTLAEEEHHLNMITRNFLLQSRQDDYMMNVRQYQCGYWPDSCTPETLFELIIAVHKWKQQFEGPVTVHDRLGLTSAATFCALSTLHQQLKHEETVDIYKISMLYHLRRPGCFPTKESLYFLYTAMKTAVEGKKKERKVVSGRSHLGSNHSANHKKHDHHTLNSIRRALSLHEDHRPHSPSQNDMTRSHSMTEHGSPGSSNGWKIKKRSSGTHTPNITEEVETVRQEDGTMAVKWNRNADVNLSSSKDGETRKLSNNNSSGSDYRESGFEEDEVYGEAV